MYERRIRFMSIGTHAERLALDVDDFEDGRRFWETDTGYEYVKYDNAWHVQPSGGSVSWGGISGTITAQTDLVDYIAEQGGGGVWGAITGTLADQTDLQTALNAKAALSHTHTEAQVTNLVSDLAGKEPANSNIQAHIASTANPHSTTAAQVGALATSAFSGLAKITVSATQPGSPATGDLWIES